MWQVLVEEQDSWNYDHADFIMILFIIKGFMLYTELIKNIMILARV
jgi:hypothetical protein